MHYHILSFDKQEGKTTMKITDKRFWIFEGFTIIHAIAEAWVVDNMIYVVCIFAVCALSGIITWLLADGKDWITFGFTYEVVHVYCVSLLIWIAELINFSLNSNEVHLLGVNAFFVFISVFIIITAVPSFVLAFVGYELFRVNEIESGE